jgi:hypothetical protein
MVGTCPTMTISVASPLTLTLSGRGRGNLSRPLSAPGSPHIVQLSKPPAERRNIASDRLVRTRA